MDFKFERFLYVDSSLSAEQQEKVRQMLLKDSRGAQQQLLGHKRREFAEGFFNLIHPDRRQTLAEEISALHSTKDESRFRTQIALLLCEAFYSGILFERGPEKEELVLATHNLGRCSEYLGKAVRHLAVNSGAPQEPNCRHARCLGRKISLTPAQPRMRPAFPEYMQRRSPPCP